MSQFGLQEREILSGVTKDSNWSRILPTLLPPEIAFKIAAKIFLGTVPSGPVLSQALLTTIRPELGLTLPTVHCLATSCFGLCRFASR